MTAFHDFDPLEVITQMQTQLVELTNNHNRLVLEHQKLATAHNRLVISCQQMEMQLQETEVKRI
jgi:3-methyladenine DNA glycosylase Tag